MAQQRIKLFVTEVGEPQSIGDKGAKKLVIKAKNPEDKILSYFTFNQKLFPHLKAETEIDADIDISTREYQGETYTDRKIVQIYIDGKPATGGDRSGGGWRGKSAEEIELERYKNRSIEAQTCLKEAVTFGIANNYPTEIIPEIASVFLAFIDEAHGIKTEPQKPAPKPAESTTPPTETQEPPKQTPSDSSEGVLEIPVEDTNNMVDLNWLKEQLGLFQKAGLKQWSNAMVVASLNAITGQQAKSVKEAVSYLDKEQADAFVLKVIDTAKMI